MIRIENKEIQAFETEHIEKVRELAAECAVLLKSDHSFPISKPGKLALYGNGARNTIKGGSGSGDVYVRHFVSVEEGLENAGFEITTKGWLDEYDRLLREKKAEFFKALRKEARQSGSDPVVYGMGRTMPEPEFKIPFDGGCDTAVYVLARNSGEGSDRNPGSGDIQLTESEIRDILEANARYEKFMLVLNVGGMVDLTPVKNIKNILLLGQLGTPTGNVFADIVTGKAYPSGKLAMTWTDIGAYPSTEGFADPDDTYYKEGIYVGYRYFDTAGKTVLYPFGYGLGYTDFEIQCDDVVLDGNEAVVKTSVRNTGKGAGKEVIQVYVSAPSGKLDRPYQELAGFSKTKELKPGEKCETEVRFLLEDLASYDETSASYVLEQGEYVVRVGNSSRNTHIAALIKLEETIVTRKLKNICIGDKTEERKPEISPISYAGEEKEKSLAKVLLISSKIFETMETKYSSELEENNRDEKILWEDVKAGKYTIEEFVAALSKEELGKICLGDYEEKAESSGIIGMAATDVAGAAGQTTKHLRESHGLDSLIMADGPAGIRIMPSYKIVNGKMKGTAGAIGGDMMLLFEPEELEAMAKASAPTEEELAAAEYYQYCTAIPIGTDLAQSFNPETAKICGDIVGKEMEMFGIHMWLAPALNIQRSPLCGRNFEYFSEDPLVSGRMAAAVTVGVQKHRGCGTTIKHFACNNQETNRYASNSIVSERALREIYLRGFEICTKISNPCAVMTSYNLINGEHACNSRDLLTYVLRDEWGYQGIVMTDWYVTSPMMLKPESRHREASAAGCVKAGNDITMPGAASDLEDILNALEQEGHPYHLTIAELQACAVRVLRKIADWME